MDLKCFDDVDDKLRPLQSRRNTRWTVSSLPLLEDNSRSLVLLLTQTSIPTKHLKCLHTLQFHDAG